MDNKSNPNNGDGEKKEGDRLESLMMASIPRRSLPPARPPESLTEAAALSAGNANNSSSKKAAADALENMTIPRRPKIHLKAPQQSQLLQQQQQQQQQKQKPRLERGSNASGLMGGSSHHHPHHHHQRQQQQHHPHHGHGTHASGSTGQLRRINSTGNNSTGSGGGGGSAHTFHSSQQQQQLQPQPQQPHQKPHKPRHVTIESEYPFMLKIRLKGVPLDEGITSFRASSRTPKRVRPSYEEVGESDGLVDSDDDDDEDDETYAARPKKLRRGSQNTSIHHRVHDNHGVKVGSGKTSSATSNLAAKVSSATGSEVLNFLDPGSGGQALPNPETGLLDAPPPGMLSSMWYSRECFLHVFAVEKIVGWKRRPVTSLEWEDPNALKILDPREAINLQQKALANGNFWNDPRKRIEISRINVTQCPTILAIAAEREKAKASEEGRDPHFKIKTSAPDQREEVLLVKWRGRSYLHCSWERPGDIQKQDPSNSTARHKIRRYYQAQEIAFGKDWKKVLEEERATAAAIHSHGEVASAEAAEQAAESEELFPPQFVEVERILGCDESEMDMNVLAKQRALNIRTEQEIVRRKEEAEATDEAGEAAKAKSNAILLKDLIDIYKTDEPWDPEDNVRYVVKWKGLPFAEMTWEYWRDIKRDAVDEAEDFWHRQKPPSPELLEEIFNIPRPHVKDFRKLQSSTTYGISSRVRPVADLGDGPIVSEEDDNDTKQGFQLRSYQQEGVNWLLFNWWNKRSCILADEMGLGKTVQTLGFLQELYNNPMTRIRGPFLIVAPLSLIGQWQSESHSWAPDFNVVLYHGSADAREFLAQQEFYYTEQFVPPATVAKLKKKHVTKFHILITTYEVVLKDIQALSSIRWKTLIVDEAHRLKNPSSRLFAELASVPRDYCVLLTGTPLANNTEELWALLHFDDPKAFSDREGFMEKFGQMNDSTQVSELHTILKPYLLRRVKEDVEKSLPPKEETILEVSLTPTQKKYYKAIYERNTAFLFKGAKPSNAPSLMNVMMELRKVCNHPYLVKGVEDRILADAATNWKRKDENGNDLPVDYIKIFWEQLVKSSGKMVLLEKLLSKLFTGGHKVLIFSQMVRVLDLLEELLKMCKYKYERLDGSTSSSSRAAAVDRFNRKSCYRFVMLLSTRAGGLGLNLTSADIVIIFDSDWNPQNDLQAMARAHRIGQTRKVQIFRLLTSKTYELHMFNSASMKLGLERAVLAQQRDHSDDTDENQKKPKSDREAHAKEIDELLKKGAYDVFRDDDDAEAIKFMESDIDQLLERSSKKVTYGASSTEALGNGLGSFSKASFVTDTGDGEKDVDLDDPDFWSKAVGLEAPVETPEEVAQMIDDGVKRSRKQVQQFNPHAEFQEKELRKEEEKEQSLLEKKDKKKKKKKKEGKEEQEGQENKEGNTEKKKKKKRDHEEMGNPLLGKDNRITPTPTPGSAPLSAPVLASANPAVPAATTSSATTPTESVKEVEVKPKKRKRNDRRRVLLRAAYIDPVIERLKQGWEAPQRNRATAAALRFGFGRFNKIRHESNLTSLPTQDLEVFIRSYMYQIALQVAVTFLARLHKSGSQVEQNFRTIIREWIGPGSEAEIEWLCSTVYSVMEHHMQVQSSRRFLQMPVVLAEASYLHTLRQGTAFRALRRMGILSRLNRVIEEGLETVLSVLGYEELAKRGCATNELSTLDADLRARHVSTEELLLVTSAHYRKPVNLEAPASWWDRNCDVALVIGSFVHGLGNYEAMRNDDDLPFIHNMRSFAESDEACSFASSAFHAAAAACRRVFDLALDAVKTKAAEEIQAAVAAAAAAASEREQNALALRQGGAAADAVLSNTQDPAVESAPKEEVVPALDDRFVTLPKLRKAILEAVRATVVKATPSKESQAEPSNSSEEPGASVVVVVPESSVTAADGDLPMPDSRVLDRRLIELLNRVESSLDEFDEEYKILEPGNNWKASDDIIVISDLRKKALSKLYTSQGVFGSLMSEYIGVGINGNQCGSSHRSLDDGTDYSIGAASSDLSLVAYGVDAPRYLRAIGVPMNLTRFAISAIVYADESTLQDMLAAERIRNYGSQQVEEEHSKEEKGNDNNPDDKAEAETNPDEAQQALQNEIVNDSKPEDSTKPPATSLSAEPNENKQDSQNSPLASLSSEPKETPHIIPEGLKHSVKARAAICSAILLYGFPSSTCSSSMVNSSLWTSLSELSGAVDGREPLSLFNMDKFIERVKSLADNEELPTAEEVGYYVENIFLPFCLRLCIMGNGPSTRNARGSKGEYETAFGISQYPEPSKEIQSPLPDPCLAIEQQSLEAVNHASAILRRVRLMRAALHVAGGDVSVEQVRTVARSSFTCKNLDGLPLWWCPWVHDVALLVHAAMNGLFAIIQDRQNNNASVGIFSRESIVSSMSSTFVADETVLPKPIIERSAPSDPQEWIRLHSEEFPTVNVLERRLAFLCSQATVALEGEVRYDNLPMFDHGGWPRV